MGGETQIGWQLKPGSGDVVINGSYNRTLKEKEKRMGEFFASYFILCRGRKCEKGTSQLFPLCWLKT